MSFRGIPEHIPKVWVIPGGIGWFHLMGVPPVRPENEQPVKEWLNVGYHRPALREDLQQAAMHLRADQRLREETGTYCPRSPPEQSSCTQHSLPPFSLLKMNANLESASPWRWAGSY